MHVRIGRLAGTMHACDRCIACFDGAFWPALFGELRRLHDCMARRADTVTKDKTRGFRDQKGNYCHIQNVLSNGT